MSKTVRLMKGDNIASLKKLEDNSIDAVVTDAPYGLGKEQDMNIVLKDWLENGYSEIKGKGFMGKEWDAYVPQPLFWKEVFRVLKPGGHLLCFFGTRTYDIGTMAIRLAGFEIRDSIQWIYGSGFPKSHNIGKAVDKLQGNEREVVGTDRSGSSSRAYQSEETTTSGEYETTKGTSEWEGWGTALKPAQEPICVARKPFKKTVAENVLEWGTGGLNIDGCRVGSGEDDRRPGISQGFINTSDIYGSGKPQEYIPNAEGRFPANIILECTCDEVIKGEKGEIKKTNRNRGTFTIKEKEQTDNYNDKGDVHTDPNCPCYIMDAQSGTNKPKKERTGIRGGVDMYSGGYKKDVEGRWPGDNGGGASRFFYQAKVGKRERNLGLDDFEEKMMEGRDPGQDDRNVSFKPRPAARKNTHPTVKPVALMAYLCRMVTPPGGTVLDPFMGSGSTGVAAMLEGFSFVGMDMDEEYVKISKARIQAYEQYRQFLK